MTADRRAETPREFPIGVAFSVFNQASLSEARTRIEAPDDNSGRDRLILKEDVLVGGRRLRIRIDSAIGFEREDEFGPMPAILNARMPFGWDIVRQPRPAERYIRSVSTTEPRNYPLRIRIIPLDDMDVSWTVQAETDLRNGQTIVEEARGMSHFQQKVDDLPADLVAQHELWETVRLAEGGTREAPRFVETVFIPSDPGTRYGSLVLSSEQVTLESLQVTIHPGQMASEAQ